MLQEFDKLVKQRKELKEWWELSTTLAAYNKSFYTLRVDMQKPAQVSFCGQQYAGGKNYYDAPVFFLESIREELAEQACAIVAKTYQKELNRLNTDIAKYREAILKELGE